MVASVSPSTPQPLAIVGMRVAKQEQQALLSVVSNALENVQQVQAQGATTGKAPTASGVGNRVDVSA